MYKTINSHLKKKFLANIHKLEMKYAVNKHFHVKSSKAMYPEQCKERRPTESEDTKGNWHPKSLGFEIKPSDFFVLF